MRTKKLITHAIATSLLCSLIFAIPGIAKEQIKSEDAKYWKEKELRSSGRDGAEPRVTINDSYTGYKAVVEPRERRLPYRKLFRNATSGGHQLPGANPITTSSDMAAIARDLTRDRTGFRTSPQNVDRASKAFLAKHPDMRGLARGQGLTRLSEPDIKFLGDVTRACYRQEARVAITQGDQVVGQEYLPVDGSRICFNYFRGNLRTVGFARTYTPNTFAGLRAPREQAAEMTNFFRQVEFDRSARHFIGSSQLTRLEAAGLMPAGNAQMSTGVRFKTNLNKPAADVVRNTERVVLVPQIDSPGGNLPEVGYRGIVTATGDVSHLGIESVVLDREGMRKFAKKRNIAEVQGNIIATYGINNINHTFVVELDSNKKPIRIESNAAHFGGGDDDEDNIPAPPDVIDWPSLDEMGEQSGETSVFNPPNPGYHGSNHQARTRRFASLKATNKKQTVSSFAFTEEIKVEAYAPDPFTTIKGGPADDGVFQLPVYMVDATEPTTRLFTAQATVVGSLDSVPGEGPALPTSSLNGIDNFFFESQPPATTFGAAHFNEAQSAYYSQRLISHWVHMLPIIGGSPLPGQFYLKGLDLSAFDSYFSPNGPDTGGEELHIAATGTNPHGKDASIIRHEMCHYYAYKVGMTAFTYPTGNEWAAINEGLSDICAAIADHYETGRYGLANNARDAESFWTMTNYTSSSDHDSGQILSIAYRNLVRIMGDWAPYMIAMHAMTALQDGDNFEDVRTAWINSGYTLFGGFGPMIEKIIEKVFGLQGIGAPYNNWNCDIASDGNPVMPMPDDTQEVIPYQHPGHGLLIFNPYSAMHAVDDLHIDDNALVTVNNQGELQSGINQGDSKVKGVFWDEISNLVTNQFSPFKGRIPNIGVFHFWDDLRIECISTPDNNISAGICGNVYATSTGDYSGTGSPQPPEAVLTMNQVQGTSPAVFIFNTGLSNDPDNPVPTDGIVAKYLFFSNNPNPVALDVDAGQRLVVQTFSAENFVDLQAPTPMTASLFVFDDEGKLNRTSIQFQVDPTPNPFP